MYIGEEITADRRLVARPSLRDTLAQRRFDREAGVIERRERAAQTLIQRQTPLLPPVAATPSNGSPIVTTPGLEPAASGSDASGGTAAGGSSTVSVTPGGGVGNLLLPLAIGAALFLL